MLPLYCTSKAYFHSNLTSDADFHLTKNRKSALSQNILPNFLFILIYFNPATPVWEHRSGNIPISFFGVPFKIASSEVWHCIHGSVRVTQS